jgi:hypothetical protein
MQEFEQMIETAKHRDAKDAKTPARPAGGQNNKIERGEI